MLATLPDALVDALARVISDYRREARIEFDRIQAEHRAALAEVRAEISERMVTLKSAADASTGRVNEALARVRDGRDGRDADPDYMRELAVVEVARAMAELPAPQPGEKGEPGKDADEELIVEKVLARMPPPEKGEPGEPGRDGVDGQKGEPGAMGEPGPVGEKGEPGNPGPAGPQGELGPAGPAGEKGSPGEPGADADSELVAAHVEEAVEKALPSIVERAIAAIPVPQDGRDGVDGKDGASGPEGAPGRDGMDGVPGEKGDPGLDGAPGERGALGEKGEPGPMGDRGEKGDPGLDGRDGVGMAGLVIDRAGCCIATMTDGTVRELGPIVGRDGAPGEKGLDGKDGRDGKDGITFEDFTPAVEYDGERAVTFRIFSKGKSIEWPYRMPFVIDRGVYKAGVKYERGDSVSFGGCMWIAQRDTDEKPNGPETGWRLAVKAGRDGRDGKDGAKGERGPEGKAGRDLTFGSQK